ncbi:MAG: pantetheine-phosphate adenylyltransferase [Deltaproteobacteria bacterium]|nr:pantetheine-phosphate adenylyltransferase [Deltaproteobacteria bacterium]
MAKVKHIGVYPGTFDPMTRGHLDIIERGLNLFDQLIVAVAGSQSKSPLFDVDERLEIIGEEIKGYGNVRVEGFDGLLIEYMRKKKARTVLRGLRVISDFEYEFQMALINRKLDPGVETVFMMTAENYAAVSSRFIKEIARLGGDVGAFVTPGVAGRLKEKYERLKGQ